MGLGMKYLKRGVTDLYSKLSVRIWVCILNPDTDFCVHSTGYLYDIVDSETNLPARQGLELPNSAHCPRFRERGRGPDLHAVSHIYRTTLFPPFPLRFKV